MVGDVNGDGLPDLITTNSGDNTVSVLLGLLQGTFGTKTDQNLGRIIKSVQLQDLNNDGKPDLVVAVGSGYGSNDHVDVFLNQVQGLFGAKTDYAVNGSATSVILSDVNSDGNPDLIVVVYNNIAVRMNQGNGLFGAETDYAVNGSGTNVVLSDVNSDGNLDLITVVYGNIAVRLNQVQGIFGAETDYSFNGIPSNVVLADVNSDGNPDLINLSYGYIAVRMNQGNGIFSLETDYNLNIGANSVVLSDVNSDGQPDLVTVNGDGISVLLNQGNGTFGTETDYVVGNHPGAIVLSDLNGDGKLDLVTTNSDNTISVALGNVYGTFPGEIFHPNTSLQNGVDSLGLTDVNGDNKLDLVYTQGNKETVLLGGVQPGTFGASVVTTLNTSPLSDNIHSWLTPNNSGDIVLTSNYAITVLHSNGSFSNLTNYPVGSRHLVVGDLNGDGSIDLVILNFSNSTISVLS